MGSREVIVLVGLSAALVGIFVVSLITGSTAIPVQQVVAALAGGGAADSANIVVHTVRLPRSLTALLAGASLGTAGLQMQTLFRNPLADPFVLGISSGASLGVAMVVLGAGFGATGGFGAGVGVRGDAVVTLAAFTGAAIVLGLVLAVSARITSPPTILILGLMFGYAASALVTVLIAGTQPERLQQWSQWGFGSFSGVTWQRLGLFASLTAVGLLPAVLTTKQLNVLLLGDSHARSMGLAIRPMRLAILSSASLLAAAVTAFCGPIAFLGIAVPHVCRALLGTSDHRLLVPAVMAMGGITALSAQTLALLPGSGAVLPLNAVTALLGAPVVVVVLLRARRGALPA